MKRISVNLAFLAIDISVPLLLCCKETEENQRKMKHERKEKKGEVAEEPCEGQHSLTSVERPSYVRSDFVNL